MRAQGALAMSARYAGAAPLPFPRRIKFHLPGRQGKDGPTHGNALVYFGPRWGRFEALFRPPDEAWKARSAEPRSPR
jgi:hypothetical protein